MKGITKNGRILKHIFLVFISFTLTSCFMGFTSDNDPFIVGTKNTYRGSVVDRNGNPMAGKTVILSSGFDQYTAVFITDENGRFEGQGDIYNTGLEVGIKNDGDFPNLDNNFVHYDFHYTEYPSEAQIEFPPLIYAPISFFSIDITNNTGANYVATYQFVQGSCTKFFEDNVETYSTCYEEDIRKFRLGAANGPFRTSVFALRGSTISVTLTNDVSTLTETYVIDDINQIESIVFE